MKIYKNWYSHLLIIDFHWFLKIRTDFINYGFSLIGHARYYWAVYWTVHTHLPHLSLEEGTKLLYSVYVTYYTNIHLAYHTFPNKHLLKQTADFFLCICRRLAEEIPVVKYEEITKVQIGAMSDVYC